MFLQLDNCSRENKNHYLLSYVELLVGLGVFQDVQVSFLPVGHTHEDIDQAFSTLARHLLTTDAHTLRDLMEEMRNTWRKGATVAQMKNIINFSGLCKTEKCICKAQGITQYRYVRFTRADNGAGSSFHHVKTNCHVKRGIDDHWHPLNAGRYSGLLLHIPIIKNTPPLDTSPPENGASVLRCFDSAEERIQNGTKMRELRQLHTRVYNRRSDPFHWNVDEMFEMNARCKEEQQTENDEDSNIQYSDSNDEEMDKDDSDDDRFEYNAGSFVAVIASDRSPFWIGKIQRFNKKNETIRIIWFEGFPLNGEDDCYEYIYKPIDNAVDTITTDTVHLNFNQLTSS